MSDSSDKISVLFVCMGNICRSPAAEGIFSHYVSEAGHADSLRIDSAGTIDYHVGSPPDPRMQDTASRRGYTLTSRARQIAPADIDRFDLIVTMDHENLSDVEALAGGRRGHIRMLGSFLGSGIENRRSKAVPDPFYGGQSGFDRVLDMIEQACPGILEHCLRLQQGRGQ